MKKLESILLIDDDVDCNFFHTRLIKKMQCAERVDVAENGLQGLEIVASNKDYSTDLILLDLNMPIMDGWKFLEEYNNLPSELKKSVVVVLLTSSVNPDDREKAETRGSVSGYINKYLDEEKLTKILESSFG